jgi:endonuclease V-like protein UPF0215 family
MNFAKPGIRVLGIAESYSGRESSLIAGCVMRKDLRIDGFGFAPVTVGGTDATEAVISLFMELEREDINLIMLSGCVISWFNVIDIERVAAVTETPVICVTYEDSDGLEGDIAYHFPGDAGRLRAYQKLGERERVILPTGYEAFVRYTGISGREAHRICRDMTKDGRVPEPLRVSRLLARSLMHNMNRLR